MLSPFLAFEIVGDLLVDFGCSGLKLRPLQLLLLIRTLHRCSLLKVSFIRAPFLLSQWSFSQAYAPILQQQFSMQALNFSKILLQRILKSNINIKKKKCLRVFHRKKILGFLSLSGKSSNHETHIQNSNKVGKTQFVVQIIYKTSLALLIKV